MHLPGGMACFRAGMEPCMAKSAYTLNGQSAVGGVLARVVRDGLIRVSLPNTMAVSRNLDELKCPVSGDRVCGCGSG